MAEHHMIKNITKADEQWRIRGRILYSWELTWGEEKTVTNLDFIMVDSEGTQIHASIPKRLFFKHKSLVTDGEIRFITNFMVSQNTGDFRVTKHQYKIAFNAKTIFTPATDLIPDRPIEFASFNDILLNKLDARYLVDVIGELHNKGPLEKTSNDKRSMMLIELIDCEGQKMILTLWEELADQMASATTEFGKSEHRPIVIIRYAKIKPFKDSSVSNSLCSKILLDAEMPEVRNFIKRKIDAGVKPSSSSTTLTSYCESVTNEL